MLRLAPEAVAPPNFQMSFAATLALIAAYERGLPWKAKYADTPLGARIALWDVYEIAGLIFASLVAAPERRRTRPITSTAWRPTVLANLLAMPIVSAGIMPAGILGLVAMPFGFDDALRRLMGMGIEWMKRHCAVCREFVGRVPAFGAGPLLPCTTGLVMLCLMRSPLRWGGAARTESS